MPSDPTPPTPNPPPPGKPRRRPAPGMGGNWLLVAIVLFIVGLLWYGTTMTATNALQWGDFIALIDNKDAYQYMQKVDFIGGSRITGEVDSAKLPEDLAYLRPKLKSNHFTVQRLQVTQDEDLQDQLTKIKAESQAHAANGQPTFD